ncbi:MAG: hypothetical protein WCF03_18945 [Nitrososphaeraceae archaeon]
MTVASVERISRMKSSSPVEGGSKIIEIERIMMHDGFGYYFPAS